MMLPLTTGGTNVDRTTQVLTKDEGGRYTPFMENYRPQLFLRTADITVAVSFPEGTPDASEKMVRSEVRSHLVDMLNAT